MKTKEEEKTEKAEAQQVKKHGDLQQVENFDGSLSSLKPGQYGQHPGSGAWFIRTPNNLLVELAAGRVVQEDDGTISVLGAISADAMDEKTNEHLFWTGTIDHGKLISPK